eukprot:4575951-Pyramimonas_sp.AAC.1
MVICAAAICAAAKWVPATAVASLPSITRALYQINDTSRDTFHLPQRKEMRSRNTYTANCLCSFCFFDDFNVTVFRECNAVSGIRNTAHTGHAQRHEDKLSCGARPRLD